VAEIAALRGFGPRIAATVAAALRPGEPGGGGTAGPGPPGSEPHGAGAASSAKINGGGAP